MTTLYDRKGPLALPVDEKGYFLPCPLCGRSLCDHTPMERPDSRLNAERIHIDLWDLVSFATSLVNAVDEKQDITPNVNALRHVLGMAP